MTSELELEKKKKAVRQIKGGTRGLQAGETVCAKAGREAMIGVLGERSHQRVEFAGRGSRRFNWWIWRETDLREPWVSRPSVEKNASHLRSQKTQKEPIGIGPARRAEVLGKERTAESVGKDREAEKPSRDGTQCQVHVEACKGRRRELSVFAVKPCWKGVTESSRSILLAYCLPGYPQGSSWQM